MKDYTWFFRGVQSAVFLYVSCGPCYDHRDKKRRKREAKQSRAEKQALRDADPVANHQPAPFEINPFWQEEIELGPGPPARRAKKRKQKSNLPVSTLPIDGRALTGSSCADDISEQQSHGKRLEAKMEQYRDRLKTLDPAHIKESWYNRRQRRDEEYIDSDDETDDGSDGHFHLRRPSQVAKLKYSSRHYMTRAPPVNDLHPPIVCTPSPHPHERKWMKERPPSAAFMAGKEAARTSLPSRNASSASNATRPRTIGSPNGSPNLGRQVTSRAVEEKLKRGEVPEIYLMSRPRGSSNATLPVGRNGSYLSPENVRIVDYANASTPASSLEIHRTSLTTGSARRRRSSTLQQPDRDSTDGEKDDVTPTTTATTLTNHTQPELSRKPSKLSSVNSKARNEGVSTILITRNGNTSPHHSATSAPSSPVLESHKRHGRQTHLTSGENMSPSLSARSVPSSIAASPHLSPIPFQARTHSTSITSIPGLHLLGLQDDQDGRSDSKLDQSGHIITVRDSSLDILQDLASPSSVLKTRSSGSAYKSSRHDNARLELPESAVDGAGDDTAVSFENSDEDDGWLWTETGERKWPDQREARNVRNRWSIDF